MGDKGLLRPPTSPPQNRFGVKEGGHCGLLQEYTPSLGITARIVSKSPGWKQGAGSTGGGEISIRGIGRIFMAVVYITLKC